MFVFFCFIVLFFQFDCLVRSSYGVTSFVPFACIRLNRSRFFFNNFVDNQSEMDLICENYELHDTRIKCILISCIFLKILFSLLDLFLFIILLYLRNKNQTIDACWSILFRLNKHHGFVLNYKSIIKVLFAWPLEEILAKSLRIRIRNQIRFD